MDIKNITVRLWITGYEKKKGCEGIIILDSIPIIEGIGLGDGKHEYTGKVSIVSADTKKVETVEIYSIHFFNKGSKWCIKTGVKLPHPPFLLISDILTECIYAGEVIINAFTEIKGMIKQEIDEEVNSTWIVGCKKWFGILYNFRENANSGYLIAFSDNINVEVRNNEIVSFDLEEPFGYLVPREI